MPGLKKIFFHEGSTRRALCSWTKPRRNWRGSLLSCLALKCTKGSFQADVFYINTLIYISTGTENWLRGLQVLREFPGSHPSMPTGVFSHLLLEQVWNNKEMKQCHFQNYPELLLSLNLFKFFLYI